MLAHVVPVLAHRVPHLLPRQQSVDLAIVHSVPSVGGPARFSGLLGTLTYVPPVRLSLVRGRGRHPAD
eukprot:7371258-Pyramimonas_sp.AAC.1